MRLKLSDIKLALETVPAGTETIELQALSRLGIESVHITYGHTTGRTTLITVFDASHGLTPEMTVTNKLYKKDKI